MPQFSKKHKILIIILTLVILVVSVPSIYFLCDKKHTEINNATINYSYTNAGLITLPLKNGKYFIVDTGSKMSYIFSDRIEINSNIRGVFLIMDEKRLLPIKRIDSLQIEEKLLIRNHDFIFIKSENTLHKNDTTIVGLIGMDILSQKHCYFDIKNQTITFSDKKRTQTELPFFVFSYKLSTRPLSDLCINGNVFEDVLFDTGFNLFLELLEKDKEKRNIQTPLEKDIMRDFFNNQHVVCFEKLDSVDINDVRFRNLTISYGQKNRLLGMVFVKCWSSFVIDPFNKKIEFYL